MDLPPRWVRWLVVAILVAVFAALAVASSGGHDDETSDGTVRLERAIVCSGVQQVLLLNADEHRAVAITIGRDQIQSVNGPTEFELANLSASLLSGDNLSRARCTDVGDGGEIDATEPVDVGTLTVTVDSGGADIALHGAATDSTAIEDVEFTDEFIAGSPG